VPVSSDYRPDPFFARLATGAPFCDAVAPAAFPQAVLRYRNQRWAEKTGLGALTGEEWIGHFARFHPLPDNLAQPLALRYHGHQFRAYNPDIGDGRGFLFAQLRDASGRLLDLATKGSGKTPYSRFGDGRLTLKGGVREILATEMLEALGVYTSKSFSLIETGEALQRTDEPSPTRAGVLVRLGHSHIRFGAFQRLAYEKNMAAIDALIGHCIEAYFPRLSALSGSERAAAFFGAVVERTARLVAQWMAAGFVHGVLNTDNMNVTGESFDYGPWRFAPAADPAFTAAYFDQAGLYAFGRQSEAAAWNLSRLGGTLLDLAGEAALNEALSGFPSAFEEAMADAFFARLGLERAGAEDFELVVALLRWMEETRVPFERVFFDWFCGRESAARADASPLAPHYRDPLFDDARARISAVRPAGAHRLAHPYFAGERPQTMLIDEVEAIWAPIAEKDDWALFEEKLSRIADLRDALALSPP